MILVKITKQHNTPSFLQVAYVPADDLKIWTSRGWKDTGEMVETVVEKSDKPEKGKRDK